MVTLMPLASYGLTGQPRRELLGAVAGEDQVGVAVDEARDHAAAGRVEAPIGGNPRALHRGHPVALEDEGRVAHDPQRTLAQRRVVGDQQADVVDRQRAHHGSMAIACAELGGHVEIEMDAVADDEPASDDHVANVGGGSGEDH